MTELEKQIIEKASKEFAEGIGIKINGSGWLVVDPLSAFLNASGHRNKLKQIPVSKNNPQVLVLEFEDGTQFIPAGEDLQGKTSEFKFENWMWID